MGTILQNINDNTYGSDTWLIVKGAVEIILSTCSHYLDKDGNKEVLTEQKMKELNQIIKTYAEDSLRCLCVAYKDLRENEGGQDHDEMHIDKINWVVEAGGLTCIAIIGIWDIIRKEVPKAIE